MILAHLTDRTCPIDQDAPDLRVGPGPLLTDGTDVYCVHDDTRLDVPDGTTTDEAGTQTAPTGWRFDIDGLTPVETDDGTAARLDAERQARREPEGEGA